MGGFVSALKKFGQDVAKFVADASNIEKKIEPIAEAALPASAVVFDVFDESVDIIQDTEGAFASAGLAQAGAAKLAAATPGISAAIDAYITAKFPGAASITKDADYIAAKTTYVNAVVGILNTLPASSATEVTSSAIIAASAVAAAVKASTTMPAPAVPAN